MISCQVLFPKINQQKFGRRKRQLKIEKKLKNGELHYEIKGAYDSFKYGLCMDDDLIRKAEILMTICAKYEYGPKYELHKRRCGEIRVA